METDMTTLIYDSSEFATQEEAEVYHFESPITVALKTFIIATVSVFVILSNMLNLAVLRITEQIPAISRVCLLNLSVADMMVGLVSCLPCIYSALYSVWPYGPVWCQIAGITHGTSVTISIWSLALVSVDRYIAILKPLHYHSLMTLTKCCVIIALMWLLAITTFAVPNFTKSNFIYYQFSSEEVLCGLYWEYPWFCVITALYIPVFSGSLLLFTTVRIAKDIMKVTPAMPGQVSTNNVKAQLKPVKVLVVTSIVYFTAWGPYVIEVVILSFAPQIHVPRMVRFTTIWLANSNSFMNVIIYSVMYRSFRTNALWLCSALYARLLCREPPGRVVTGTNTDSL